MARRNFMESNNPMVSDNTLDGHMVRANTEPMTVSGAVNKTYILFAVMLAAFAVSWTIYSPILMWVGIIGVPVVSFIASRDMKRASLWAPVFSVMLGLMAGAISARYEARYGGIVFQAVTLTFAILFTMLTLYKAGIIKVTERFRSIMSVAVGAVMLLYLVSLVVHLFGGNMPFLHEHSPIGIGISLVIVGIASLKLTIDFDNFYKGEAAKAPAHMEWYFGMGLMFTLVWLYTEILWLLSAFSGD